MIYSSPHALYPKYHFIVILPRVLNVNIQFQLLVFDSLATDYKYEIHLTHLISMKLHFSYAEYHHILNFFAEVPFLIYKSKLQADSYLRHFLVGVIGVCCSIIL